MILANIHKKKYILLYSPVHTLEIESISDWSEQKQIHMLLSQDAQHIYTDLRIVRQQTDVYIKQGLGVADAAHLAFAEISEGCVHFV